MGVKPLVLLGILALGAWLRMNEPLRDPWYTDECKIAELAESIAHKGHTGAGILVDNGILPSSTSLLAPALAALFIKAGNFPSLVGLRLYSGLLGTLACLLLYGLGKELGRERLGMAAAALYAVFPFAVSLDRMGFYHHLGAALGLFSALLGLRFLKSPTPARFTALMLVAGLCPVAAYWLFWMAVPACLAAWMAGRWRWLAWGLPLFAAPMALSLLVSWRIDPSSFMLDLQTLARISREGNLPGPSKLILFAQFCRDFAFFPLAALGALAGLGRGGQAGRPGRLMLAFMAAGCVEVFRQRANPGPFPYPLILVNPWACLGLAAGIARAWEYPWSSGAFRGLGRVASAMLPLLCLNVPSLHNLRDFSILPEDGLAAAAFIEPRLRPGEQVMGVCNFNWLLPSHETYDPDQALTYWGSHSQNFFPDRYPASRFVRLPDLAKTRFMAVADYEALNEMQHEGASQLFLRADYEGWPLLYAGHGMRIYGNPAFGYPRRQGLIMPGWLLYTYAAVVAANHGDMKLADYAKRRGREYLRRAKARERAS